MKTAAVPAAGPAPGGVAAIRVSKKSLREWDRFKAREDESYEDMVNRLLRRVPDEDDDLLTEESLSAIRESRRDFEEGRFKTVDQVRKELGFQ